MSIKRYFKQAWGSLTGQPLLSTISVGGTALAIFLIMVIFMMDEVKLTPFAPVSNRDRWLIQVTASIGNKDWGSTPDRNSSTGPMSYYTIRRTFYEMTTPEAVATFTPFVGESHLSVKGKTPFGAVLRATDDGFWKVMDFTFVSGHPYEKASVEGGSQVVVLSESLARKLFDTTDCIGRTLMIDHVSYRVCGVVRDVSDLAGFAKADLWIPLTSNGVDKYTWSRYMGPLGVIILAHNKSDFPKIREEYKEVWDKFEDEVKEGGWEFYRHQHPHDQFTFVNHKMNNKDPDMGAVKRHNFLVYTILLLIPAINLSSLTQSRLSRRREEIGVRRSFGATGFGIMVEMFIENLIITLIAGLIGLLLSLAFIFLGGKSVLAPGSAVSGLRLEMVSNMSVFGMALFFCFLLNLLSSLIPSWQASRSKIVNALTGHNK